MHWLVLVVLVVAVLTDFELLRSAAPSRAHTAAAVPACPAAQQTWPSQ